MNDRMYLKVVQNSGITYNIITIPSTNYTGTELVAVLQPALNYYYPGLFTPPKQYPILI